MTDKPLTRTTFRSLKLSDSILRGLTDANYIYCTPIQDKTLPLLLQGQDVAGQAQTGTGKTAAFLIAAFHHLLTHPPAPKSTQPRALILAPTRELAIQIYEEAKLLGRYTGLRFGIVYGGAGYVKQQEMIKAGLDIMIGTPGRIIDYFRQKVFHLHNLEVAVIDEADRMFDLGFIRDLRYLLRRMPKPQERLGLLFSATLSYRVTELAYEHMNNPELVRIEPEQVTAKTVRQCAYYPSSQEKIPLLIGLLRKLQPLRCLVFVNTKKAADRLCAYLTANGIDAAALSGDVPQQKRQRLLKRFQENNLPLLIATDVAARGLHIPDVSHVFNFDLPQDVEDYVHRIGRTARLGASGMAISLACEEYAYSLPDIESFIGQKIPREAVTDDLLPSINRPGKSASRSGPLKKNQPARHRRKPCATEPPAQRRRAR